MSTGEWTPPELRSQDELKAMIAYVTEHGYGTASKTYVRGVLAALNWVTGETAVSPITGTSLGRPVTGMDASSEHGRAYEALYANSDPALWKVTQENGTKYTVAIEHALSWVTGSDALWSPWET